MSNAPCLPSAEIAASTGEMPEMGKHRKTAMSRQQEDSRQRRAGQLPRSGLARRMDIDELHPPRPIPRESICKK